MAKGMYMGISSVARKIKKGYIGIDGVARKIKKAYIGVDGVARLIFSSGITGISGTLNYYGTGASLSVARMYGGSASNSSYALFAGGHSSRGATVDTYNTSLTKSTATDLSSVKFNIRCASLSDCAIFLGGNDAYTNADKHYKTIDGYNTSLTKSTATADSPHVNGGVAIINNYALFCGGFVTRNSSNYISEAYNSSLTKINPSNISNDTAVGAYNSSYAVIAGNKSVVDTFNASLTKGTAEALINSVSIATAGGSTAGDGAYAVIACGRNSNGSAIDTVVAYDTSLTRSLPTALSVARYSMASTSLGDYAIFGGGYGKREPVSTVDAYDGSLTRTVQTSLTDTKYGLMATSLGKYALFGGGWQSNGSYKASSNVNIYHLV